MSEGELTEIGAAVLDESFPDVDMALRRLSIVLLVASVFASMGAGQYRTQNFVIHAPSQEVAQQVGDGAVAVPGRALRRVHLLVDVERR